MTRRAADVGRIGFGGLIFAAALAAACGGGGNGEPGDASPPTAPATRQSSQPDPIEPGLLASLLAETSDFQRDLMEDGMLTLDEYERAKLAQIQCLLDAGFAIEPPQPEMNGMLLYQFMVMVPPSLASSGQATITECSQRYADAVDRAWSEVSHPLIQDVIAESKAMVYGCLVDSGFDPGESGVDPRSTEFLAAEEECATAMRETLDMVAYWGYE